MPLAQLAVQSRVQHRHIIQEGHVDLQLPTPVYDVHILGKGLVLVMWVERGGLAMSSASSSSSAISMVLQQISHPCV